MLLLVTKNTEFHSACSASKSEGTRDWNDELQRTIGLGVAGNFAGHLEQVGEASNFKDLKIADANAPKGVFPFYVPATGEHFLHCMPVSPPRRRALAAEPTRAVHPVSRPDWRLWVHHDLVACEPVLFDQECFDPCGA